MGYIKKETIIEFIEKGLNNPNKEEAFGHDAIEILAEIEFTPEADVVEVVKCKGCAHFHRGEDSTICDYDYCDISYYCDGSHRATCEQDFCSYGTPKERGDE